MPETYSAHEYASLFATLTNQNVFLTGKAGTGKTTFLHRLRETSPKQIAVVAPTGVAAINAGGTTIHSFFQLPLTPFIPTEMGRKELIGKMKMQSNRRKVIRELELLVIDEISMVRADILDAIDTVLRHVRYRHNEPFGGVQMIFIGDMYQLSPVAQNEEWQILSRFYQGVYFFNSLVFQQKPFVHIEFEKIFRQKDIEFIQLLNEVRNNRLSAESLALLGKCYNPFFVPAPDDTYIILTTHNYKADRINREELDKIKSGTKIFEAVVTGDFPERSFPADDKLELKIGAKVMFLRNDSENPRRFFNGKIGQITGWDKDIIRVKCPEDNEPIAVLPVEWENIRYQTDESTLLVKEDVLGTFRQYPLRLAWAITIHKSQGLTFDKAVIDAESAFAAGQVYVALSRCRSLEGLVLQSKINAGSIQNDNEILRFSSRHLNVDELENRFSSSRQEYFLSLLLQVFDFRQMVAVSGRWLTSTADAETSFGSETLEFLRNINAQINAIHDVGARFGTQISQILKHNEFNHDALNLRLEAADTYFSEKLNLLTDTLRQSPATTDSRENAKEFDQYYLDIFTFAAQKKHWISGIRDGFGIEKYFQLRKSFELPAIKYTSYSRHQKQEKLSSRRPDLMGILYELRNSIVDDTGLPVYMVAGSHSIAEMADYLPQTKSDLLKISGFGEARVEKFGELFLEEIRDYCLENGLTSAMDELAGREKRKRKEKKEKSEKKIKGSSALLSFQEYKSGKSVEKIAAERSLSVGTIYGHLGRYVTKGELTAEEFVPPGELQRAKSILEKTDEDVSIYSKLKEHYSQGEITIISAWLRKEQS